MATLKEATKVEVIRQLSFEEYGGATFRFGVDSTRGMQVTVEVADPPTHKEREAIRREVIGLDALELNADALQRAVLDILDKREEADSVKVRYDSEERKPRPYSVTLWLSSEQREVLENLLAGTEVSYDTRQFVNQALSPSSDSRW